MTGRDGQQRSASYALRASAGVWAPTSGAVAAAQTLLVAGDPVPAASVLFILQAVASGLVFAAGIWLVSRALVIAFDGQPVRWRAVVTPHSALGWAVGAVALLVLLALLSPYLTVLGIVAGLLVIPAAAAGAPRPLSAALGTIRRAPGRFALRTVVAVVVWALSAVGMLLLGFFVTGPVSVVVTWLALSVVGTALLASWTALYLRARATD